MTIFKNLTTLAVSALLMAGAAQGALADNQGSEVVNFLPKDLVVVGNGETYTKLQTTGNGAMGVHLWYDAGTSGRIRSWTATPMIWSSIGAQANIPGLSIFKKTKSYSVGNRPKTMNENHFLNIPLKALEKAAVEMCNDNAGHWRARGKSSKQIFATDHTVEFITSVLFQVDATGVGSAFEEYNPDGLRIPVTCKKWTGPSAPVANTVNSQLEIKKATMKLEEVASVSGDCKVKLTTVISTNKPGATVKFRYVHAFGKAMSGTKSNVFTVKTASNKIAVVKHDWDIPNGAGPESGSMRMEGVSPNFTSNQPTYSMSCKGGGGGAGGFSAGPAKPGTTIRAK